MKFDHVVKHNGIRYAAGEEVPIKEEKPVEAVAENVFTAFAEPETVSEPLPRRRGRAARKE